MAKALKEYDPWEEDEVVEPLDDFNPKLSRTEKEETHPLEKAFEKEGKEGLVKLLSNKWWRINNLYFIVDKWGNRVLFQPNTDQTRLYDEMWFQNLILKARQRGFTTFIDIYILDECIFNSNVEAGIIAHNREDVSKIFRRKILYPYNNMPEIVKAMYPTKHGRQSKTEIEFANDSIISVGTSMRSGTLKLLHVSEFGKVCARFPEKAREIVTGSFEAIHTQSGDSILWVESTAEGRGGYFFDYCKEAQDRDELGQKPTEMEFKFHFYPWWDNTENELQTPVPIPQAMDVYFAEVEAKTGIKLRPEQKYWYITKWKKLGDDMKRENPSTPEEAFEQAIKGAYFTKQFIKIRKEKRICSVPHQAGSLVDTWWDLGMNDVNTIWFTQDVGREVHVINYHESNGEGWDYYKDLLDGENDDFKEAKKYQYGTHNGPHDLAVREFGANAKKRLQSAAEAGIHFNLIPRVENKMDSINAARRIMPICWFDEENCSQGIERLENYRKDWNEHLQTYRNRPLHDINSNGADGFQSFAMGHKFQVSMGAVHVVQKTSSKGWT